MSGRIAYPPARRADVVDDYHGDEVPDPYRWLEDPDSPESRAWIEAENAVTAAFLADIPARARIHARLTRLWDYEKYGVPFREGGRTFWFKNDGLQNQSVLYVTPPGASEARVLLDPNTLSPDGTVALTGQAPSRDGRLLAYGLAHAGSDWNEWRVRDVDSGQDLPDLLCWIKFSGASWTTDGRGFFYSRYDEPAPGAALAEANYWNKLFYHRLGSPQTDDVLVLARTREDEKEWSFDGGVTDDGRYLVITVFRGTDPKYLVFYKDLEEAGAPAGGALHELVGTFEAEFAFIGNDGPLFWFKTNLDAPRGRVIAVDTRRPGRADWREVIPEREETLGGVSLVADRFVCSYLRDAHTLVRVHALDGRFVRDVALPGLGTAMGFGGRRSDRDTFYVFTGFTAPAAVYHHDVDRGESALFRAPRVDFDPAGFETRQVFYASRDGTRVPMYVSHRKGLALDGRNPTYLYGYGGFNISLTPWFSVSALVWMEMGGVYAVANLRGGGEYGEEWHRAGTLERKQNVFDDFIAGAEWLVARGYTSPARLAIAGASNGGLLVGACLTQRPDLFGAALPAVGVMDMLRFHKYTIGWAWIDDYGSSDDPAAFRTLRAYSPLHNVRAGAAYPATLITTADHDDRVVPAHSFKFAATLQAAQAGEAPVLIRIDTKAGHGLGKPTAKLIDEISDQWAFLVKVLGIEPA